MINNLEIAIGEKIKSYRKKREITQEQLAEYLNISFQSVSKWECGESYPDITMLPKIALFFGITTDELLCIDKLKEQEDMVSSNHRSHKALMTGNTQEAVTAMREANAKYPGNFQIMKELVEMLYWDTAKGRDIEHQQSGFKEIISIGEKIRAECRDDKIRRDILQYMCIAYRCIGESEKAINLANEDLADINLSKEIILIQLLDGDKLIRHRQENLLKFLGHFSWEIKCLSESFTAENKIAIYKNILGIYFMIFKDGDFGHYNYHLFKLYMDIAGEYINEKNNSEALENIKNAAVHAIDFGKTAYRAPHTSPLIDRINPVGLNLVKNYTGNEPYNLLKNLGEEKYNVIRDTPEFIEICENLKQHADKNG